MPIPTYSKDLPEIPEDIARKAYDVYMFFKRRGHNAWAFHHLCSRDFVDAEVARITNQHKKERFEAEAREHKAISKLHNIWKELDPMFNPEE